MSKVKRLLVRGAVSALLLGCGASIPIAEKLNATNYLPLYDKLQKIDSIPKDHASLAISSVLILSSLLFFVGSVWLYRRSSAVRFAEKRIKKERLKDKFFEKKVPENLCVINTDEIDGFAEFDENTSTVKVNVRRISEEHLLQYETAETEKEYILLYTLQSIFGQTCSFEKHEGYDLSFLSEVTSFLYTSVCAKDIVNDWLVNGWIQKPPKEKLLEKSNGLKILCDETSKVPDIWKIMGECLESGNAYPLLVAFSRNDSKTAVLETASVLHELKEADVSAGEGIPDWMTHLRLSRAKRMLVDSEAKSSVKIAESGSSRTNNYIDQKPKGDYMENKEFEKEVEEYKKKILDLAERVESAESAEEVFAILREANKLSHLTEKIDPKISEATRKEDKEFDRKMHSRLEEFGYPGKRS